MTDSLRQGTGDKLESNLKPDSQKSTLEQAQDSLKSTADSVAGTVQPEGEKSTTQKASDTLTGSGGDAQKEGESYLKQAQDGASNLAESAKDTLGLNKQQ